MVNGDNYSNNALIKENSYNSGSSLLSSYRVGAKNLSFSGFITVNLQQYNRILGLLQQAVYLQHKDDELDGYQPICITSMGIEWQEGGFLRGGIFTLELTLLTPYFESFDDTSDDGGLELPTLSFEKQTFTVYNASYLASSFLLEVKALEPNRKFSISLSEAEGNLTFTDLNGFGSDYFTLRLDSSKSSFEMLMTDGSTNDISAYLTADSGFFLLQPGENKLEIISQGKIQINTFLIRHRWYI